jgi:gluconate 2-dehydrogenase gamma chain
MRITRRKMVAITAVGAARATVAEPLTFFTPQEAALVEAIAEQFIPTDDDAGAREAGVVFFIDRQLAGKHKRHAAAYRKGLPALDAACRDAAGKPFLELDSSARRAFLQRVERDEVKGHRAFFEMVLDHTMQGYFGHPKHGGNRGQASWKMLKITDVMHDPTAHTNGASR